MKIIRFKLSKTGKAFFGCVEQGKVYLMEKNPVKKIERGLFVASLEDVEVLAPCLPSKIIAMAINFPGIGGYHSDMAEPLVFIKPATCIANPGETIINPFPDLPWWGEAELAVVIKNRLRNASLDDVIGGVLGFTIANDVTVENVESRDHHLARSKCPDTFCPIGPWIDTDFDTSNCVIEAIQNNEVIRRGCSSQQIWQWPQIITWLSTWITLESWDVVLTGNPPDTVGMRFLTHGDTYTARIEGLGELTNKFVVKNK